MGPRVGRGCGALIHARGGREWAGWVGTGRKKARKQFFFEKKNQKTLVCKIPFLQSSKSFLFLFFKKEILPCFFGSIPE
jgi:hypothetical protein